MDRDVINIIIIVIIIQELNYGVQLALTPHLHSIFPLFVMCNGAVFFRVFMFIFVVRE
jgi:hypothetical protein